MNTNSRRIFGLVKDRFIDVYWHVGLGTFGAEIWDMAGQAEMLGCSLDLSQHYAATPREAIKKLRLAIAAKANPKIEKVTEKLVPEKRLLSKEEIKALTLGLAYGMGPTSLSNRFSVTIESAAV